MGRGQGVNGPLYYSILSPEAVNDNDARARRGERRTGRTRQAWQGQNARSPSQLLLSPVWIGLDLGGWTFDLLMVGLGAWEGLISSSRRRKRRFRSQFFERGRTAATLPRLHGSSPKRNMGLKILVLAGWVRW